MNGFNLKRGIGTIVVSIVKVLVSPGGNSTFGTASLQERIASGRSISRITQSAGGNPTTGHNPLFTDWNIKPVSSLKVLSGLFIFIDSITPLIQSRKLLLAREF